MNSPVDAMDVMDLMDVRDRRRRIVPERQAHLFMDFPSLGLWKRWRPRRKMRARSTAAEKRIEAARRDPRQESMFGPGHTDELTGW